MVFLLERSVQCNLKTSSHRFTSSFLESIGEGEEGFTELGRILKSSGVDMGKLSKGDGGHLASNSSSLSWP